MTDTQAQPTPTPPRAKRRLETPKDPGWLSLAGSAFRTPGGFIAVLVIAAQAIWRGGLVAGGFFTQDDYLMLERAANDSMSLDHLGASHAGEFSPLGNLIVWATTQVAGIDWGAVTLVVVGLQTVVAVLTWVVLTQILEDRWVRIPLLAVACFTPLTLGSTLLWSLATTHLPAVALLLGGISALLAHLQTGWQPGVRVAAGCFVLVMFCSDRALLLPVVSLIAVAALLRPDDLGVRSRLVQAVSRYGRLWVLLLVALVARVLLSVTREGSGFGWPSNFNDARYIFEQYFRQGIAGLAGGPWAGEVSSSVLVPSANWPLAVAVLVCLLLSVPVIRCLKDPVVTVSAIGLVGYFLLGAVVLLVTQEGLNAMGMVSRFVADVAPAVVLCLALALRRSTVPHEISHWVRKAPAGLAVVLAIAYLVSAAVSTRVVAPVLQNSDDRDFVEQIRTGLELDPRIVLLDGPVPDGIMSSWFGNQAKVSTVVGLLPEQPTFDLPSEQLRMVDGFGILREVQLAMQVTSEASEDQECGWRITSTPLTVPMKETVSAGDHVMTIGYLTSSDTYAQVVAGDTSVRVPIRNGLNTIFVPVKSSFDEVEMTIETTDQTVCVGAITVGVPVPAPLSGG